MAKITWTEEAQRWLEDNFSTSQQITRVLRPVRSEGSMNGHRSSPVLKRSVAVSLRGVLTFYGSVVPFATVIALLEIAIEGREGWARLLYNFGIYWDTGLGLTLGGGKPWTPYHALLNLLYLITTHIYLWKGERWTGWRKAAGTTARCFAWLFAVWTLEDFLWFLFNPFYGLGRLTPEHVWWHNWIGPIPDMYIVLPPLSALLYALSNRLTRSDLRRAV